MLADRIDAKWIDAFCEIFERCAVKPGDTAAILSETQSRALNVQLAELALLRMGAKPFHIMVPTPRNREVVPVRSTGASIAIQKLSDTPIERRSCAVKKGRSTKVLGDSTSEDSAGRTRLPNSGSSPDARWTASTARANSETGDRGVRARRLCLCRRADRQAPLALQLRQGRREAGHPHRAARRPRRCPRRSPPPTPRV